MPMTSNPFAPRNLEHESFDARSCFTIPRLDKIPGTESQAVTVPYTIYCAGAPHLAQFSRLVGLPIYKIGVARFGLHNRISGLSRHRYAGYWGHPGEDVSSMTALPGADQWVPIRLPRPLDLEPGVAEHVQLKGRGIRISLSATIHPETVDRLVDGLLQNLRLRTALETGAGQHRARNGGVDPRAWFHTYYRNSDRPDQLAEARELYIFDPKIDTPNLLRGLARLVKHYAETSHGGG